MQVKLGLRRRDFKCGHLKGTMCWKINTKLVVRVIPTKNYYSHPKLTPTWIFLHPPPPPA